MPRDENGETLPWENFEEPENFKIELKEVYGLHKPLILKRDDIQDEQSVYNFPIDKSYPIQDTCIMEQVENIFHNQSNSFKLNLSVGLILQNTETCEGISILIRSILSFPNQ